MIIAPGYLTAEECRTGSRDKTWLQLLTGQATAWFLPDLLLKQTLVNKGLRKLITTSQLSWEEEPSLDVDQEPAP